MLCHVQFSNTLLDIPASKVFHIHSEFSMERGRTQQLTSFLSPRFYSCHPPVELGLLSTSAAFLNLFNKGLCFLFGGIMYPWLTSDKNDLELMSPPRES